MTALVVVAALLLVAAVVALPFVLQRLKKRPVPSWVTTQGVFVYGEPVVPRAAVEHAIDVVVAWWAARYPAQAAALRKRIAASSLVLVSSEAPPVLGGVPVWGWTTGLVCSAWNQQDVAATVAHEVGVHQCLYGLGDRQPEGGQHARAAAEGFPWAHGEPLP